MSDTIKQEILDAINEVRGAYPRAQVHVEADKQGGAYVVLSEVDIGATYKPQSTWIGFQITFQYPFADVYPHYITNDIVRVDGKTLVSPINPGQSSPSPAVLGVR